MEDQPRGSQGKQPSRFSKSPHSGSGYEVDGRSSLNGGGLSSPSSPQFIPNSKEDVRAIAQNLATQTTLPKLRPDVWGVLTAISDKARTRTQGSDILLHNNEHVLGRTVKDALCQFDSPNVSAKHCKIFRKKVKAEESNIPMQGSEHVSGDRWFVYIKDSSSNGTFINWQRLKRDSPEIQIQHGDIISLVNAPEHENAFAFVYREVVTNMQTLLTHQPNGAAANSLKRKNIHEDDTFGEGISGDAKRVRGLGICGPDGPVSLDDVRRLQRSNEELRQQLEAHVLTIEKLRAESRAATARHDAEIKELRETLSVVFLDQIKDLRLELVKKEKELEDYASLCAQQQRKIEDLNRSLAATTQSRTDAEEMIQSQKLTIVELKEQLEDERSQRRNEREKAEVDLKAAVERVRSEASEELKRQSEAAARQLKEQLEMISKLQEADKENRFLVETLRSKLEDSRENLVKVEKTSRSLELRLHEEELASVTARKKIVEKELELQRASKELENEKAAREEALAKLSSLEVEMESAIQDLAMEKQRLQGARERILLRETQLRAFHSTAEEIAALQQKQQEQLKSMLRTLEDGDDENYASVQNQGNKDTMHAAMEEADSVAKADMSGKSHGLGGDERGGSNDAIVTKREGEKADVGDDESQSTAGNLSGGINLNRNENEVSMDGDTQVDDHAASAQLPDPPENVQTATMPVDEHKTSERCMAMGTEAGYTQLLETESNTAGRSGSGKYVNEAQLLGSGRDEVAQSRTTRIFTHQQDGPGNTDRGKDEEAEGLGGETMQLEDEDEQGVMEWGKTEVQMENQGMTLNCDGDYEGDPARPPDKPGHCKKLVREDHGAQESRVPDQPESISRRDAPMTTLDLLTSEVAGSWAISTPASVHCDNGEWSESEERDEGIGRGTNEVHVDFDASQVGNVDGERVKKGMQKGNSKRENLASSVATQNSLSPRTTARHDRERRDLNEMLDIVAPDFSRLHGLSRVPETAPDSEDHTEEEDNKEEDHESDGDSTGGSEPVSQSPSVSARY